MWQGRLIYWRVYKSISWRFNGEGGFERKWPIWIGVLEDTILDEEEEIKMGQRWCGDGRHNGLYWFPLALVYQSNSFPGHSSHQKPRTWLCLTEYYSNWGGSVYTKRQDLSKVIHGFLSIVKWIRQKICLTIKIVWLLSLETSPKIELLSADWKHQLFTTLLPMLCDGHFLWQYVTNLQEYVKEFVTYYETYLDNGWHISWQYMKHFWQYIKC